MGWSGPPLVDEPLPLAVHGDLYVLQLVVAAHLERGEHGQTHPRRERAPRSKLIRKIPHLIV